MTQLAYSVGRRHPPMAMACSEGTRYAIYYTPAKHSLLIAAAETWLGRSAFPGAHPPGGDNMLVDPGLVGGPSQYGFHATLKPPFRMAADRNIADLESDLAAFAARTTAFPIGRLKLAKIRGFFALVPAEPLPRLDTFASSVVEHFDSFRAPFTAAELQRGMKDGLDDDEATLLVRWGYPYVFERFKFHLTLTNTIPAERQTVVETMLRKYFEPLLNRDYAIDAISLFEQRKPGEPFLVRANFPLAKGAGFG